MWTKLHPILTPHPSFKSGKNGHFTYYLPFVKWPTVDFPQTPQPPLLVHVVIERPLRVGAQGINTVHAGEEGWGSKWQNSVYVVVEWPLTFCAMVTPQCMASSMYNLEPLPTLESLQSVWFVTWPIRSYLRKSSPWKCGWPKNERTGFKIWLSDWWATLIEMFLRIPTS